MLALVQDYLPFHGGLHEQEIARAGRPKAVSPAIVFLESFLNMAFS